MDNEVMLMLTVERQGHHVKLRIPESYLKYNSKVLGDVIKFQVSEVLKKINDVIKEKEEDGSTEAVVQDSVSPNEVGPK